MKEPDWLAATDPEVLLKHIRKKMTERQLRLYLIALCRLHWQYFEDSYRHAVEVAERHADGAASAEELQAAHDAGMRASRGRFDKQGILYGRGSEGSHGRVSAKFAWEMTEATCRAKPTPSKVLFACRMIGIYHGQSDIENSVTQTALLRDVVGNPFRPVTVEPGCLAWSNASVPRIAQRIYVERAWGDFPILGDAFEEAGCRASTILEHCRGSLVHGRGCWVLDLAQGAKT